MTPQVDLTDINEHTTKGGDAVTNALPAMIEQVNRTSLRASSIRSSLLLSTSLFKQNQREQAIAQAFDAIDVDKSGKLDEEELFNFLREAASHAKLEVEDDVIHAAVRHLIEQEQHAAEEEGREEGLKTSISDKFISRDMFYAMFERNPELYRVFDTVEEQSRRSNQCFSLLQEDEEAVEYSKESQEKSSHQLWKVAKLGWKRKSLVVFWLLLYVAATITVFTKIAINYARNEEFTEIFGNCIVVARASAKTLNLNAALILLPISRHFITSLRHVKLPFPFDISLDIHMLMGTSFAIFALSHVMAHVCDYERLVSADQEDLEALFGDKLGGPIPTSKIGRLGLMMKQRASITGIIMVICLVLAYSSIRSRRQNFNRFWYLHHLLLIMLIMMCVHGTGDLFEAHQSIYWICGPLALYIFPRLYRELSRRKVKLLSARAVGDILDIQLEKPEAWEKTQRAGMYALINIPDISKAEWHPFTLCSSPADDHIRFSIRNAGDWTNKLHKMVLTDEAAESSTSKDNGSVASMEEAVTSNVGRVKSMRVNLKHLANPIIRVEGPFGASSQGFSEYPIVVLVGAGIGVTVRE
jgi:predicted ferric reductase